MTRLATMLAVLALGLAMPAVASAQLGPTNVPDGLKAPDQSQTPRGTVDDDDGLSTLQLVLIFGAAIAVIGTIAFVIVRDARGTARGGRGGSSSAKGSGSASGAGASKPSGKTAREREREQAAKRKKAKAARDQRKHNRPR